MSKVSKGWLGGKGAELEAEDEENERLRQKESSQKVYDVLKKNLTELSSKKVGLDGESIEMPPSYSGEEAIPLDSPIPSPGKENAEFPKKESASLERIMKATGILSSLLREMIAVGATQSWDTSKDRPGKKFVEIEGELLRGKIEQLVPSNERDLVYRMLKDEVSVKRERDKIVGDILLKFAFPYCS